MRSAVPALAFAMACGRVDFQARAIDASPSADATLDAAACAALVCLDPTFASGGVLDLSVDGVPNGSYGDQGVAIQPDGRIVIVGKAGTAASSTALVARIEESGVLDPSFGSGGVVELAAASAQAIAVTVAATGDIVVGGNANGAGLLAKLDATGQVDPTFGVLEPTFGGTAVAINGVAVDTAGRVLAGGQADFANFDLVAGAWLGSGGTDPAFTPVHYDGGRGDEFGTLAGIAPDGGLDIVGQTYDGTFFEGLILHTTNEGALDPSFGSDGIAQLAGGSGARFLALAREADERIVVTGQLDTTGTEALVERFSASGVVDPAWVTTSIAMHPDDVGRGIVQLPDGRIVVGVRGGSASTLVVLDDGSGSVIGSYELPIATAPNGIDDLLVDRDGRLLVFGDAGSDESEIYLARVLIP
ncbi:MAG TPA: hypothetical protein VGL61_13175 [Kofleriaceae bacterium]